MMYLSCLAIHFWWLRFMPFLLPLFVEPILHLFSWNARTCDFLRDHVNSCRMSILNTPKTMVQQMWFIFKAQCFRPYKSISVTQILLLWHSMWWLYLPEVIGISMNSMGIWNQFCWESLEWDSKGLRCSTSTSCFTLFLYLSHFKCLPVFATWWYWYLVPGLVTW